IVYLFLSRAGPLGGLGLLFTPAAMIIAQTVLVTPIVAAITRQVIEDLWRDYGELYIFDGVGLPRRRRSWRHPDCRRQYRRRHPHDDDRHYSRNKPGRSRARAGTRRHPCNADPVYQCRGANRRGGGEEGRGMMGLAQRFAAGWLLALAIAFPAPAQEQFI